MAVRPYTPEEFQAISGQLASVYREGELKILRLLQDGGLTDWREAFLRERLAQVQAIIAGLNDATTEWAGVHIPAITQHNLDLGARVAGLDPGMTAIHQEQVALTRHSVESSLNYANGGVGRAVEDAYRQASLKALQEGMIGGETRAEVSKSFLSDLEQRGITSFTDKSGRAWDMSSYAEMVARTNTMEASKAATTNQLLEAGRDLVQVSDHADECDLCAPWEGDVLSLTGKTEGYRTVAEAEAEGLFHPNCCVGETLVASPGVIGGYAAQYNGDLVELVLANGARLAVTVNHQLLTPHGFAAAHSLHKGDDIIYCPGFEGVCCGDPYDDSLPPSIREIVETLTVTRGMSSTTMPVASEYFHGDGRFMHGNVHVVAPDGLLQSTGEAASNEGVTKQNLGAHNTLAEGFSGGGDLTTVLVRLALAAHRPVRGVGAASVFLGADTRSAYNGGLVGGTGRAAGDIQPSENGARTDAEAIRQVLDGCAGAVQVCDVKSVIIRPFAGHVYDLQTVSTLYVANGVVSSNCLHDLLPYGGNE